MYKCKHFQIHELVPKKTFQQRGEAAWQLIDDRLLFTIDSLRALYGSITINNYNWGGNRQWSCLRTSDSPYYSPYSQHSFGRAADCIFKNVSTDKVRQDILKNPDKEEFKYINAVELKVSWLHVDIRNVDRIFAFNP
jgi:hypothetical protein